jgi:hypothetical protein
MLIPANAAMRAIFDLLMMVVLRCWMTMMCVMSFVTASKERQTSAKSCKAGKVIAAYEITSSSFHNHFSKFMLRG